MRRSYLLFLAAAVLLIAAACSGGQDDGPADFNLPDLDGREVTIAVENAYLPFNFILLGENQAQGWDYDVIGEICRRLNCRPAWIEMRWDFLIGSVAEGEVDMSGEGITITMERAGQVSFSDPYLLLYQRLMVRIGETRFADMGEFLADETLILGGEADTYNINTAFELAGEERVVGFETFEEAVDALVAGEIDGIIYDEVEGLGYFGPENARVEFIDEPISQDGMGFIFRKGSDLIEPFNLAIESLKADGFMQSANWTWFGPDFDLTYNDVELGAYGSPTPAP